MEEIKLKTNRIGVIKFLLPIFIALTVFFTVVVTLYFVNYDTMKDDVDVIIAVSVMEIVFLIIILSLRFLFVKTYVFTRHTITVYRGKKAVEQYETDTIINLFYNRFRLRTLFGAMLGGMLDGGCWKLYARFTNGSRDSLGMFSVKDMEKLKGFYGDYFQIVD
ncbi:MAG: hypothetical protein K2M64_02625, partial [Clostridia bacterium]|nr:hypothetical protein [Clostridia bacterium]